MKRFYLLLALEAFLFAAPSCKVEKPASAASQTHEWALVFADEFNRQGDFDTTKWSFCPRKGAAWSRYLTAQKEYASLNGRELILKMDNRPLAGDDAPYHAGGIQTQAKFRFTYGRVEVRARFSEGQGSWPAIWMMPDSSWYGGWPRSGEVDIMEHVNREDVVHQTIHNASVTGPAGGSSATHSTTYRKEDFNIYGITWSADSLAFLVNGQLQYTYRKPEGASTEQWPFDKPFYLILNQSGGAGWPGPLKEADLPFTMEVDWVRVYQQK